MQLDWRELLEAEVERTSLTAAAKRIGYARTSLSLLLHGKYIGNPNRIIARIVEALAAQIPCPYLNKSLTPSECKAFRERPMPQSSPNQFKHWSACRSCEFAKNKFAQQTKLQKVENA